MLKIHEQTPSSVLLQDDDRVVPVSICIAHHLCACCISTGQNNALPSPTDAPSAHDGTFENDIAAVFSGISADLRMYCNLGRNGPEPIPICGAPPPQPAPRGKHCRRRGIWRRNTPSRHKKRAWCPAAVLLHLCPGLGFKTAPHHSSDEVSNVGGL